MADSQIDKGETPENVNNPDESMMSAESFEVPHQAQEPQVPEARQIAMIDDDEEGDQDEGQEQMSAIEIPMEVMDHDYYSFDSSQRSDNADSQEFPEIPPLDIFDNSSNQEMDTSRIEKPFFESPPSAYGARGQTIVAGGSGSTYRNAGDSRRLLIGGQQFAYSNSPRAYPQPQRPAEYASPSFVGGAGYQTGGVGGSIRRIQTVQSAAGTPGQMSIRKSMPAQRPTTTTTNKTMTRVMPPPIPQAEPPHRALLTSKQPATMSPGLAYQSQVLNSQSDDSMVAPRGGAPLLVAGRGAKPVIRGRGSAGTVRRKDGEGEETYEEHMGRGSPRKVNFIDGIAPGGTTMTSPSGTVNLVVGAPPHGSMHIYDRSVEHGFQDDDAAVQQNLHAIQQSMEEQRDPRLHQRAQHKEPLANSYMSKLNEGECSFRTMAYAETRKLKNTFPDVPPDPVPEPRPRGRPRGSTNRTRLSSQSGGAPATPLTPTPMDSSSPRRVTGKSPPMKVAGSKSPVKGPFAMVEEIDQMPPLVPPPPPTLVSNIVTQFEPKKEKKEEMSIASNGFTADITTPPTASPVPSEESDNGSDYSQTTAEIDEWGDYVTRCWCEMDHNDENMIQCEKCNVWQHMKCMGIPITKPPDKYLCERCEPRQLKWNKEQAREYQERKQAEILKEISKRRADRRKRNEERKKAKEARKAQKRAEHAKNRIKRNEALRPVSGLQFRKYTEIKENEYSDRAKKLLQRFPSTQGAAHVVGNVQSAEQKYGRMFVAPGLEGLVAIKDIPKNDLVIEYLGFVSSPSECPGREKEGYVQPHCVLYSGVAVDSPLVIDARRKGGDSRYVRRSCRPNTVLKHVVLDGRIHVLLNATEPIEKSAEITIPFDSDYQKCPRPLACACGDEACCPIADFNARIIARSPTPTPKRKLSTGAASAKKAATPSTSKATPASARKGSAKKTPKGAKPQGRQPMIKLRRHDTKEARESKDEVGPSEEKEEEQEPVKGNRATRAARRSELQPASTEIPPAETPSERRETRRQKKESEGEQKETKQETTPAKGRGRGRAAKVEPKEESEEEEEEPKRRGRRSAAEKEAKEKTPKSPVKPGGRSRNRTEEASAADRSKLTREERKLQQELAIFEKLEHKDKGSKSPAKEVTSGKRNRRGSEKSSSTPLTATRERLRDRTAKTSPQKDNAEKEPTRSPVTSPAVIPPRKRWQMEQKQREEEEAAAINLTPALPDFSQGKKAFLLRRAQADREKEEPAPPDPAPSSPQALPPQNFAPPLKKRRHTDADFSQPSMSERISHPYMSPNTSSSRTPSRRVVDPPLRELLKDFAHGLTTQPTIDFEIKTTSDWPPVTEIKKKKLSLDEYKRRRTGNITASTSTDTEPPAKVIGKKSFIPNIHDADNAPAHLAPVPDPRSLSSDSPLTDLDELKRRVYGQTFMSESSSESRLEPPPPPPVLRSPLKSPPRTATAEAVGSPEESTPRGMSIADRLRMQFGHLM